ncbi:MAG: lamin tail domain-containing protein [Anaerolineae bacterium]|nr:lamin tail domain-containing protein [Anaerolineae bacterium]
MNRRALVVFVILNIAISIGVALVVISLWSQSQPPQQALVVQTIEVLITTTPGPTQTPWVVTVQSNAPAAAIGQNPTPGAGEPTVANTLNPDILPDIATNAAATQTSLQSTGSTETTYTVASGDTPCAVAESFDVACEDLLCLNGLGSLSDPDNIETIFPGDLLIIPGADFVCDAVVVVEEPEETPAADVGEGDGEDGGALDTALGEGLESSGTAFPTVTLAPTAADAQVIVRQVIGAGDVTTEGVEIVNQGGLVDLEGWTLYDTEGNTYTFPEYRLFPNSGVTIFSRVGEDTPAALFWGATRAVWQRGDVVTLADANGEAQSTFEVGQDG